MTDSPSTPPAPSLHPRTSPELLRSYIARMTGDEKHYAAAHSTLEVISTLYDRVLNLSPDRLDDTTRDRFLLSKGHGPMAYYAVLAAHGYFPASWLDTWAEFASPLGHHPDRMLVPGVEISSGSLGHGLPMALGTAVGLRAQGITSRVVVLVGDAELDEGSNIEAIQMAAALRTGALICVVIDNRSATYAAPGGLHRQFEIFGWRATVLNGRDGDAIASDLLAPVAPIGAPRVIVAQVDAR